MALGAQRRNLLRLVVGQGILLVLIGAAIGIAAAIRALEFHVDDHSPEFAQTIK